MIDEVKSFYERYTFPFTELKNESINGDRLFRFLNYEIKANNFKEKYFLDAGCGTGHRILDVAKAFPDARFLGFDLSHNSIEIAKKQAKKDKVNNIEFENNNILEYNSKERFDIISVQGVIHHLKEPEQGIKNLTQFLKDDGLFVAFIVNTYGESDRMLYREVLLTLLSQQKHDLEAGRELMQEMGFSISKNRYGQSFGDNKMTEDDEVSKDADALLHPQWLTFTFQEAMNLFKTSNLEWVAIDQVITQEAFKNVLTLNQEQVNPFYALDIKSFLKSKKAYAYYQKLSKTDKLHIIELMVKPTGFMILAGKSNSIALKSKRIRENSLALK